MKTLRLLLLILASVVLTACGTLDPAGVYAGDKILYESEVAAPAAFAFFQTFVKWEYDNRAVLPADVGVPAKKAADFIRANAPAWKSSVLSLHDAYLASPTPENRRSLESVLGVIRGALTEAAKYMAPAKPVASYGSPDNTLDPKRRARARGAARPPGQSPRLERTDHARAASRSEETLRGIPLLGGLHRPGVGDHAFLMG